MKIDQAWGRVDADEWRCETGWPTTEQLEPISRDAKADDIRQKALANTYENFALSLKAVLEVGFSGKRCRKEAWRERFTHAPIEPPAEAEAEGPAGSLISIRRSQGVAHGS